MSVLAKAALALDLIARYDGPIRLADAAAGLGLPKSSTHRLLNDLVEQDLLRRDRDGRFELGVRLLSWGKAAETSFNIHGLAKSHMDRLSAETGETVNLHVIQGDHRVCLATSRGLNATLPPVPVGQALPLGTGAAGKVLLAFAPHDVRERVLVTMAGAALRVPSESELSAIRLNHWATSLDEQEIGLSAGATVILGTGGRAVGALAVGGHVDQIPTSRIEELRPRMIDAALALSKQLGGTHA